MSLVQKMLDAVNSPMFQKVMPWVLVTVVMVGGAFVLHSSCNRSLDTSPHDPTQDMVPDNTK